MKIVSWNMNYWQQKSTNESAWNYLVSTVNPDIALLQETVVPEKYQHQTVFIESKTCRTTDSIKWGTCVFVNETILLNGSFKDVTEKYIKEEDSIGKQVFIEVNLNGREQFTICSLHTNTSPDGIYSIKNHIQKITENLESNNSYKRFIFGGDFNADIEMDNGFFIEVFNRIKINYHECIPKHTQTYFGANMSERNHYQDDHLFVSKDLSNSINETFSWNYGKLKQYSDHTILETELAI